MELPTEVIKKIKDDTFKIGERIGDWEFVGNTTKPGDPKWNEWKNTKTGQSTMTIHDPVEKIDFGSCNHFFIVEKNGLAQCRKCGFGQRLVWGKQVVKDGKIYNIDKEANQSRIKSRNDRVEKLKKKRKSLLRRLKRKSPKKVRL